MNFLYGDSTPSPLRSNVLEFFRDALDCSVVLLQADLHIKEGNDKIKNLRSVADAERSRLETFIGAVARATRQASSEIPESPTLRAALRLEKQLSDTHQRFADEVKDKLAADIAALEAEELATRENCTKALATLLSLQAPPDAGTTVSLVLQPTGTYDGTLLGAADFGLDWTFELSTSESDLWSSTVRVERVMSQLEIRAPQLAGWISKEVKIRPQRLERYSVTELTDDNDTVVVKLKAEGADFGFELELESSGLAIKRATRTGPKDDASVGPFEVHADDAKLVAELVEKLLSAANDLKRENLVAAAVEGGAPFQAQGTYMPFVQKLVAMMAPILREISDRSLTPSELVLRRLLDKDRREEIFIAKSTLREKYTQLPEPMRAVFLPLGLLPPPPKLPGSARTSERPPAATISDKPVPARAELPASRPPPPLPAAARSPSITNPGISPAALAQSDAKAEAAKNADGAKTDGAAKVESPRPEHQVQSEALGAALRKIVNLSRSGRTDEAYEEYRTLFSSPSFAEYSVDDQRHALRLMAQAKSPAPQSETVLDAHRAAVVRLKALIDTHGDPADHEMLGTMKRVASL